MEDHDVPHIYFVTYSEGQFHSSTTNYEIASARAAQIKGFVGELRNVHSVRNLRDSDAPEEIINKIEAFLADPSANMGTRTGRPVRKSFDENPTPAVGSDPVTSGH